LASQAAHSQLRMVRRLTHREGSDTTHREGQWYRSVNAESARGATAGLDDQKPVTVGLLCGREERQREREREQRERESRERDRKTDRQTDRQTDRGRSVLTASTGAKATEELARTGEVRPSRRELIVVWVGPIVRPARLAERPTVRRTAAGDRIAAPRRACGHGADGDVRGRDLVPLRRAGSKCPGLGAVGWVLVLAIAVLNVLRSLGELYRVLLKAFLGGLVAFNFLAEAVLVCK
jgi:hypothetical protein